MEAGSGEAPSTMNAEHLQSAMHQLERERLVGSYKQLTRFSD